MVGCGTFTVNRICKLTGISKTTYYASCNPVDRFQAKYEHIRKFVEKIIRIHPAYGIRRIKAELEEIYKINIGRDTLGKLLNAWGLGLKRKVRKQKISVIKKILSALADRANLLIRADIQAPLQAITSDITEFLFRGGKAYLCVHKDAFGQMVYGWHLDLNMKTGLVIKSLRSATKQINRLRKIHRITTDKPLLHQDRGSQYVSYKYVKAAMAVGKLSYSDPGNPTHNPGQESFFGRFKDEWKDEIAEIETFEELKKFVKQKIKYYNYNRRHTSADMKPPWTFTKMLLNSP